MARLGCGQPPPDQIKKEIEALRTDTSIPVDLVSNMKTFAPFFA